MRKKIIFVVLLLSFISEISAQKLAKKSQFVILGVDKYTEYAIGRVLQIQFLEDPTKCDPRRGNMTLEEQVNYFAREMMKIGIDFSQFSSSTSDLIGQYRQKKIEYLAKSDEEFTKIATFCNQLGFQITETYFKMPEHRFESEDVSATKALNDAIVKAKFIAKKLGGKKVSIVKIDDDTSSDQLQSLLSDETKNRPDFDEILEFYEELLGSPSQFNKSYQNFRERGYSILVTFEIN